jgi:ferredoxin
MATIDADRDTCAGYANCVMTAEDYFELDDDGTVGVIRADVAPQDEARVSEAVAGCPVSALRLTR